MEQQNLSLLTSGQQKLPLQGHFWHKVMLLRIRCCGSGEALAGKLELSGDAAFVHASK